MYSRRALTRVEIKEDVWVYWRCNGRDDLSRIRDLSLNGLFIQTRRPKADTGVKTHVEFLVQEGCIRADAIVRHVEPGSGLGLKFIDIVDRSHLRALINRLRS